MTNSKTGYICIDPLTYFLFLSMLVQNDTLPEALVDEKVFKHCRTKGNELNTIYTTKIQLVMEVGIEAYKILIEVLKTGIVNETYDIDNYGGKFSKQILDDLMRYMCCTKYIYKINPENPIGFVPNKHNVVDEKQEGTVFAESQKAKLIKNDDTIKFERREYALLLNELNNEFLTNSNAQTFIPVSLELQDKICDISKQEDGIDMPMTYLTQFIIMNALHFHDLNDRFPNIPYELANMMLAKANEQMAERNE